MVREGVVLHFIPDVIRSQSKAVAVVRFHIIRSIKRTRVRPFLIICV